MITPSSPRRRRQELRKAAGFTSKPYDAIVRKTKKKNSRNDDNESASGPESPNLGMPTRAQYNVIEKEYIRSLHPRKREKALLTQVMFDKIWDVLHDPTHSRIGSPQFRWWVRKMFKLSYTRSTLSPSEAENLASLGADTTPVVLHEDRPVALKDQIYDVLCYCHDHSAHGGRDKTTKVIREHYSWIPKELVAQFVKACPTCIFKKTGSMDLAMTVNIKEEVESDEISSALDPELEEYRDIILAMLEDEEMAPLVPPEIADIVRKDAEASHDLCELQYPSLLSPNEKCHPSRVLSSAELSRAPSYNAEASTWSSLCTSATFLPSAVSAASCNRLFSHPALPPLKRFATADGALQGPMSVQVPLPPLMKALSESGYLGYTGTGASMVPALGASSLRSVPIRPGTELQYKFSHGEPSQITIPYSHPVVQPQDSQIDPSLLRASVQPTPPRLRTNPSIASFAASSPAPPLDRRTARSVDSLITGSASFGTLTLHPSASAQSRSQICLDSPGDTLDGIQSSLSRFSFPTSVERHDFLGSSG